MKSEVNPKNKKVITKRLSNEPDCVENIKENQNEADVSVFTKSTNPKVVVWSEKFNNENVKFHCDGWCSWKIVKFVFMIVMSSLLIITFFVSIKTYHIVENLYINSVNLVS